jgi:hypothetical protein
MLRCSTEASSCSISTLTQRCYTEGEVRSALAEPGFEQIEVHDADEVGHDDIGPAFFLARKPSA